VTRRYNAKVNPRSFLKGDLVWRMTGDAQKNPTDDKLAANWRPRTESAKF